MSDNKHFYIHTSDPEFDLITRCLCIQFDRADEKQIIPSNINSKRFLDICARHTVRPLIHRALASVDWRGVPTEIHSSLGQFYRRNTLRNSALTVELLNIMASLRDRGIKAATFKGPVLAEYAYGSIALREFVDIDIIVRAADFARAEQTLADSGFRTTSRHPHQQDYFAQSGQASFRRPGERFSVDLHWKLAPLRMSFPFEEDEIWSHLQMLPLAGTEVPSLSWDHMALFTIFHGAKERWRSLKWICDFAELVRSRPELDWESLRLKSARSHCSRSLLLAGRLSFNLGLACPPELLAAALGNSKVEALANRTLDAIYNQTPETDLSIFLYMSQVAERFQDKSKLALTILTTLTVSDFQSLRLHPRLRGLYYLIRPLRILIKAIGLLARRTNATRPKQS